MGSGINTRVKGFPLQSQFQLDGLEKGTEEAALGLDSAQRQWDTHSSFCLLLLLQDVTGCALPLLFQFPFREKQGTSDSMVSKLRPLLDRAQHAVCELTGFLLLELRRYFQ